MQAERRGVGSGVGEGAGPRHLVGRSVEGADVHFGFVGEGDAAFVEVGGDEGVEGGEGFLVAGLAGGGGVRGGEPAAFDLVGGEAEVVAVAEEAVAGGGVGGFGAPEEVSEEGGGDAFVVDLLVVVGEGLDEAFVTGLEFGGGEVAFVPDEGGPGGEMEDAAEFVAGLEGVEPVEGLAGDDEVEGRGGEGGVFGGAVDAGEAGVLFEEGLSGGAHGGVGFDAEDAVAVVEEQFGEESGAGADIDDDGGGGEGVEGFEVGEEGLRVGGAELDVVFDAGGEALGGVGGVHGGMIAVLFAGRHGDENSGGDGG